MVGVCKEHWLKGVQGATYSLIKPFSMRISLVFNQNLPSLRASGLNDDKAVQLKAFIDCKVTDVLRQA